MKKFRGIVICILLLSYCNSGICYSAQDVTEITKDETKDIGSNISSTLEATEDIGSNAPSTIEATEIDMGDYQDIMEVGEKQLLIITVLPVDTTDQTVTYKSSNETVATINGMGRITALLAGATQITVSCGEVQNSFQLEVKQPSNIVATEIDLGDYQKEMVVGERQLISATVLPAEATDQQLTYLSDNENIAKVNDMGRITAVSAGTAKITVTCGTVQNNLQLVVKETNDIQVTDIEIGYYEEEMEVDMSQTISATVKPSNATNTTVTYSSSDTAVATVLSSGEVKGMNPGTAIITVRAGNILKDIKIEVKTATAKIQVNKNYLVLKPGGEFRLIASVEPADATQAVTFKSVYKDIAEVTADGTILAKNIGATSVIVSNGDLSTAVTVIVNESGTEDKSNIESTSIEVGSKSIRLLTEWEAELIDIIRNTTDNDIEINTIDYQIISKNILKDLYEEKRALEIKGNEYTIRIDGSNIRNYENELNTEIQFVKEENGTSFIINENDNLPGCIELIIHNSENTGKYLYLHNTVKEKYQLIKNDKNTTDRLFLDTTGKYLLTNEKNSTAKPGVVMVIILSIGILIAGGVYIIVKKKYWFW